MQKHAEHRKIQAMREDAYGSGDVRIELRIEKTVDKPTDSTVYYIVYFFTHAYIIAHACDIVNRTRKLLSSLYKKTSFVTA